VLIRSGFVVDGTGEAGRYADVGVRDGKVSAVGHLPADTSAETVIDADGCWVTPGFIDIHTHYDAQVTWDSDLRPSTDHGVTTVVMGNCGVGFAPVAKSEREYMVHVMEGVEDIPGSVLSDGIVWSWESFPQYLDFLADRRFAADVATQVPYSALRVYAMGQAGKQGLPSHAADLQKIEALVREALEAGAVGISISRVKGHQVADGSAVPGTEAPFEELAAIARGMNAAGSGVFQLVPSGFLGDDPGMGLQRDKWLVAEEMEHLRRFMDIAHRPVSLSMSERSRSGVVMDQVLAAAWPVIDAGYPLFPQFASRAGGVIVGFTGHHMFERRPSFVAITGLPRGEKLRRLRDPAVKRAILEEDDLPANSDSLMDNFDRFVSSNLEFIYALDRVPDYEPCPETSLAASARRLNRHPYELMYELMLEDDGNALLSILISNYATHDLARIRDLLLDGATVVGLGDAGAHVRYICDASTTTSMLTHWVIGRTRGERIPLELAVKRMTLDNANLYGLKDRGRLAEGYRADINVIDPRALELRRPTMVSDLPGGGSRFVQHAQGYRATLVNGILVRINDARTKHLPGRLVRGA
jgi:N-acyl-D-amino-acid deacylase